MDMLQAGIIDPTKVTRSALQNAASVASLMLTTEVMITDLPEEKSEAECRAVCPAAWAVWAAWAACTKILLSHPAHAASTRNRTLHSRRALISAEHRLGASEELTAGREKSLPVFFNIFLMRNLMPKTSAGILMYRKRNNAVEVFLVHPGGPFFKNKDAGVWSIPKGELDEGEDELFAAKREFEEETGCRPEGTFIPLSPVTQKGGKIVVSWAVEGDCDADSITSNTFSMEWPPKSGRMQEFPEADWAGWFEVPEAKQKINPAQAALLDMLLLKL